MSTVREQYEDLAKELKRVVNNNVPLAAKLAKIRDMAQVADEILASAVGESFQIYEEDQTGFNTIVSAEKDILLERGPQDRNLLDPDVFLQRLADRMTNAGSAASFCEQFSKEFPSMDVHPAAVYRSFERDLDGVQTVRRVRAARETGEVSRAREIDAQNADSEDLGPMRNLEAAIAREYERTNSPIPLYQLILNPNSFSQTVENMFHLSFLVRDLKVSIRKGEGDVPVVIPLDDNQTQADEDEDQGTRHQFITEMNYAFWKELRLAHPHDPIVPPIRDTDTEGYTPVPAT